jgi:hypothetical protein
LGPHTKKKKYKKIYIFKRNPKNNSSEKRIPERLETTKNWLRRFKNA